MNKYHNIFLILKKAVLLTSLPYLIYILIVFSFFILWVLKIWGLKLILASFQCNAMYGDYTGASWTCSNTQIGNFITSLLNAGEALMFVVAITGAYVLLLILNPITVIGFFLISLLYSFSSLNSPKENLKD